MSLKIQSLFSLKYYYWFFFVHIVTIILLISLKRGESTNWWIDDDLIQLQNPKDQFLNAQVSTFERGDAAEDHARLAGGGWTLEEGRARNVHGQQGRVLGHLFKYGDYNKKTRSFYSNS